jgi:hypothetical protein
VSDADRVVHELTLAPTRVATVRARPELVPAEPGFYAWWCDSGAIADVPHVAHPLHAAIALLYVGISPSRDSSRHTVRGRVLGNHLGGNIGSSTFRFVLAALLIDELALRPQRRLTKVVLRAADNARLSAWQREHLSLTWCVRARPWEVEHEVIAKMTPPLNSSGNATHPFYARVREARAALRERAATVTTDL